MRKTLVMLVVLAGSANFVAAQAKISGTGKCGKGESQQPIEVGDRPNHALLVVKQACTWTTPLEMEGLKSTDYTVASVIDSSGAKSRDRGYVVLTMDNGDKAFASYTGASTYGKDGALVSGEGTWSYTGGTGKLKGITGKGTYKGSATADGGSEDKIEGDYAISAPKKK